MRLSHTRHLSHLLTQNDLQDPIQSGFKVPQSTEMALMTVTETFHANRSAKLSSLYYWLANLANMSTVKSYLQAVGNQQTITFLYKINSKSLFSGSQTGVTQSRLGITHSQIDSLLSNVSSTPSWPYFCVKTHKPLLITKKADMSKCFHCQMSSCCNPVLIFHERLKYSRNIMIQS